ncbi:MAG: hypothetical protein Fues2KO_50500 [Fuerstiella sp.]
MNSVVQLSKRFTALSLLFFVSSPLVGADSKLKTVATPGGAEPLAAETDAEGTIHLLIHTAGGPQYVRTRDDGHTFSKPIFLVDYARHKPGLEFEVWDMAVGPAGRVHVALGTNAWKLKLPQEQWGFFYTRLDPQASAFTPVRNINRKPSEGFSLAAHRDGRVAACWLSDKLYVNVSHDYGNTFSPTDEINPELDPCNCCTTSATWAADGRLAVLYREETDNKRDMFLVLWDQNNGKSTRTAVSRHLWEINACPMTYYKVAAQPDGFAAVWPTKGQVYFAQLDASGAPRSPTDIRTPGKTGTRTGILALTAPDRSTLVAWKNGGQLGWQIYDKLGQPSGKPGTTKSSGKGVAGALSRDGQFILFR